MRFFEQATIKTTKENDAERSSFGRKKRRTASSGACKDDKERNKSNDVDNVTGKDFFAKNQCSDFDIERSWQI